MDPHKFCINFISEPLLLRISRMLKRSDDTISRNKAHCALNNAAVFALKVRLFAMQKLP